MKIGLEIEAITNAAITTFAMGGYHNGARISENWKAESDSSIRRSYGSKFNIQKEAEFVSGVFKNKKQMLDGLIELRKVLENGTKRKFSDLMYFNKSCGAHIHFDFDGSWDGKKYIKKGYKMYNSTSIKCFIDARNYFFKLLKESKVIPEKIQLKVMEQYERSYAQILPENRMRQLHTRTSEWNFTAERNGTGMEWRGFNLRGVKTYDQFREMYKLALKTLLFLERSLDKWVEEGEEDVGEEVKEFKPRKTWRRINLPAKIEGERICVV